MKIENKKKVFEYLGFLVAFGVVMFIATNTDEAKKLVGYVMTVLRPFIYGFVIAFILNLLVKQFDNTFKKLSEKKGKPYDKKQHRVLSIILSILVFLLFAGLTIGMIIPNLKNTAVSLYNEAPELWDKFVDFVDKFKVKQPKLAPYITSAENSIDSYVQKLIETVKGNLSNIVSTALSKVKGATNVLLNFALGLIIAFAVLVIKEELVKEFDIILKKLLSEKVYKKTSYILKLANNKFQIYFKYNVIQAVITGTGTFLVMLVTGMPYKVSIALLITVTQLIPIIGAILGTAVSALLIAAVSPIKAIIFVCLSILVQQIVEKLINPHLMGKELDMPGVLTFLAIVIGGKQFGLVGLICSVPVVSICYDLYTQDIRPKLYEGIAELKTDKKEEEEKPKERKLKKKNK